MAGRNGWTVEGRVHSCCIAATVCCADLVGGASREPERDLVWNELEEAAHVKKLIFSIIDTMSYFLFFE